MAIEFQQSLSIPDLPPKAQNTLLRRSAKLAGVTQRPTSWWLIGKNCLPTLGRMISVIDNQMIESASRDFCKKHGITSGWNQAQHVGFVHGLVMELKDSTDFAKELAFILTKTCNPSAFRQRMEDAGILLKGAKISKVDINPYLEMIK